MSSFNRRTVLFGAAACLTVGGFTPAFGRTGGGTRLDGAILMDEPKTEAAYQLTRRIEDRLGRNLNARFGLSYSIDLTEVPIANTANNINTRYNILGEITYALRDLDSGAVVTSGKMNNFTSYSRSVTTLATQAAEKEARDRLMLILGDQIITRLIITAPDLPA